MRSCQQNLESVSTGRGREQDKMDPAHLVCSPIDAQKSLLHALFQLGQLADKSKVRIVASATEDLVVRCPGFNGPVSSRSTFLPVLRVILEPEWNAHLLSSTHFLLTCWAHPSRRVSSAHSKISRVSGSLCGKASNSYDKRCICRDDWGTQKESAAVPLLNEVCEELGPPCTT